MPILSKEEILNIIFEKDEDLLPLIKNYLVKYLEDAINNPEDIISTLLEQSKIIKQQKDQIELLKADLDYVLLKLNDFSEEIKILKGFYGRT